MANQRMTYLYQLYLDKGMNPDELEEFKNIILDPNQETELHQLIEEHWNQVNEDKVLILTEAKVNEIFSQIITSQKASIKYTFLWARTVGVAAAIALILSGIYFFNKHNDTVIDNGTMSAQDIAPGSFGATLTLASGKKINLSDVTNGEIASESGITIKKTADGQLIYQTKEITGDPNKLNILSTSNGETFMVSLPDKSKVWLNASSSLTYSPKLNKDGKRKVKLEGEAYFEITKDKEHPFIVTTDGQEVEVLGTHFNINAYKDENNTRTTLLEGSVKVAPANTGSLGKNGGIVLKPNQQSILDGSNQLKIIEADPEMDIAWKNGFFAYKDTPLDEVMRQLARWYNVEIEYESDDIKGRKLAGSVSRYNNVSGLLKVLEDTGTAHFKLEKRKIFVSK